jgi:predicted ATPase
MRTCACARRHDTRLIVLTGGPGAGKTAVLELVRQQFCEHLRVLPEAAGIVFGGGFPRTNKQNERRAAQRAIYFVQCELEQMVDGTNAALVLCDRGTVDGAAYWPGPDHFWTGVGSSKEQELGRYEAVIHLRTPRLGAGYSNGNPLRTETAEAAAEIDEALVQIWEGHPRRFFVPASTDFLEKATHTIEILRREMPECCQVA